MPSILDSLPALYRDLLPDFFERDIPAETKATCNDCAMCRTDLAVGSIDGRDRRFRADTKCCTFFPRLPNYLVGAILSDTSPDGEEGRRRIRARIERRVGVEPVWLRPPGRYTLLYNQSRRAFGRSEALLCPFYERPTGNCTIWRHRESVCATYFCRYVAGEDGRNLWMAAKSYLSLAEVQLARLAAYKLYPSFVLGQGRSGTTEGPLTVDELDDVPPPDDDYLETWGDWACREEEFYRKCHEIVREVPRPELARMLGFDGELDIAGLERLYRSAVTDELPNVLRFNPRSTVKWLPDGSVALGAYSDMEAVSLPGDAWPLIIAFDGHATVEETRARLRDTRGADLDEDVLRTLFRHRVLDEG